MLMTVCIGNDTENKQPLDEVCNDWRDENIFVIDCSLFRSVIFAWVL